MIKSRGLFKLSAGALLGFSALSQLWQHEVWWFIQIVNLVFHEAGHVIFGLFGSFTGLLGGSLLELLIPLFVTLHFTLRKEWLSAAFGSWWFATACLSVSIYASDAQERYLPLLGGDAVLHDWHTILTQLHLLPYDYQIGYMFWLLGVLAVGFLGYCLWRDQDIRSLLHRHALR